MGRDLEQIVTALKQSASVAILSHVRPEGDTLGSALGCHLTLKSSGKEVATFNPDPVPMYLRALPGASEVIQADRLPGRLTATSSWMPRIRSASGGCSTASPPAAS